MAHPILMPKPGQMTEECVLVAWRKKEGDPVRRGDILFEIESDKSNMDVEAFDDGVLLRRYVEEGQSVPVNSLCAYVGEPGEVVPDAVPGQPAPAIGATAGQSPAAPAPAAVTLSAVRAAPATVAALDAADGHLRISPRAARLAATLGFDPRPIAGTGPGGRIVERDVQAAADGSGRAAPAADVRMSPRARQLAAAAGIDPRTVKPSGPGGRVTERDVRAALEAAVAATRKAGAAAPLPEARGQSVSSTGGEPGLEPRPLSRMRRVIAERLTLSATTIPQFTVTVAVDMTDALAVRAEVKASGVALTVTDLVVAATARTLVEFPDVNSLTDGILVWPRHRVHMGLAVALPAGLVVPVIRDADRLSIVELHDTAARLVEAARAGSLGPDDMAGSTFTISNLGMHGVDEFHAIINPGESAILAVSSALPTPFAIDGAISIRQIMKVTLTADHRLVDGELAARFLDALRRRLQDGDGLRSQVVKA